MGKYIPTAGDRSIKLLVCFVVVVLHQVQADPNVVPVTFVSNAAEKGAVCNDGTPASYYFSPGFGEGVNKWHIYLNGGGWCNDDESCQGRLGSSLGSSNYVPATSTLGRIKSINQTINPDFYDWNKITVNYCDSSSYMGGSDHLNFTSRGGRIFDAVIEEMLPKGIANATDALLFGTSAGGLATILHCDGFRSLFPNASRVKCLSDSGFFLHAPKLNGAEKRAQYFSKVAAYHGFTNKLPQPCTSKMNASLCIFPQYIVKDIQTPLFLLESKFDTYQLGFQNVSDDTVGFNACLANTTLCTPSHRQSLKNYGVAVSEILQEIRRTSSIAMFVHPCMRHGHLYERSGWHESYVLKNKTIAQAVGDWFNNRDSLFQEIDTDHQLPLVPVASFSQDYKPMGESIRSSSVYRV